MPYKIDAQNNILFGMCVHILVSRSLWLGLCLSPSHAILNSEPKRHMLLVIERQHIDTARCGLNLSLAKATAVVALCERLDRSKWRPKKKTKKKEEERNSEEQTTKTEI